jgi:thioredoxin 1
MRPVKPGPGAAGVTLGPPGKIRPLRLLKSAERKEIRLPSTFRHFSKWLGVILALSLCLPAAPVWGQAPPEAQGRPALYDFGMGMCLSCVEMEKILHAVKSKYGDQLEVRLLYAAQDKNLFSQYKIIAVPTQVFLNAQGQEVDRHMGVFPEGELVKKLKALKFIKE